MGDGTIQKSNKQKLSPRVNREALKYWGKTFFFADQVLSVTPHGNNIDVRLKSHPRFYWIGWPDEKLKVTPKDLDISKIKARDWVRVDFIAHRIAWGAHFITKIRKLNFFERYIKLRFLGRC